MNFWDWENIQDIFENIQGSFVRNNVLPKNISRFSLERTDEQHLLLTTISPSNFLHDKNPSERSLGEVFVNDNVVQIESPHASGTLEGLTPTNTQTTFDHTANKYKIHRLTLIFKSTNETTYSFDWIANIPENYIWPNGYDEKTNTVTEREIIGSPSVKLRTESKNNTMSYTSARLRIGDVDLIVGKSSNTKALARISPGYILYLGNPDSEKRKKIRDSISFALGTSLVYLGNSSFDAEYRCKAVEAISPHTVSGRAWDIHSLPPAPITANRSNMIDRGELENLANSFFSNADQYDLQQIQWRIWYARVAPYYMAPAYYGALIETLQAKFTENPENKISSTIIDKASYRKVSRFLKRYLTKQKLDSSTTKIFDNKISNGNSAPQKLLSERFYTALDLDLGVLELDAWNRRNDAAHGNPLPLNGEIDLIRETKILAVMVNRIMLKLINGSSTYIDYYTFNYPLRPLKSSIPPDSID